jgi:peptide/nickel transport system substrate-binding protein
VTRTIAAVFVVVVVAGSPAAGASAQVPARGGTVRVAYDTPAPAPSCVMFRFVEPACPNGFGAELMHLVLAGNLKVRPEGWTPNLVSRSTVAGDPFTVTLHIRPDARWSDGELVTAPDYVFSHRVYSRLFPPDRYVWSKLQRVSAIDAKTVRLHWGAPDSLWLIQTGLFPTLPRHVLRGENVSEVWERAIVNPKTGQPIGSGPFLLERFRPARELVLVRNPRFWDAARLDRLVIRFGSNTADALRRGDVDIVGGSGRDLEGALELAERPEPGIRVVSGVSGAWEHLDLNLGRGGHPALRSKLVRRALAYGIDREAIVRALWARTAPAVRVLDSTAFLTTERSYEPSWSTYRYRPAQARRLLRQAGCRQGADGIFVCGGERLRLRFVTVAGNQFRERTLELVQSQLLAVGVEAVPEYAANLAFVEAGAFDAALFAWRKDNPGESGSWPYSCAEPEKPGNVTGYCSRLFNADFDQLRRIVDPARYATVANRADRRLARDVPVIPLYQQPRLYAYRDSIRGIVPNPFWAVWWNGENWWLER